MTSQPGQSLLHYRLIERIGEGGMGEIWRADDTTLDRRVAIKILPQEFAADPDRLARFEREAKLLASLNHPNIAAIYGLHEARSSSPGPGGTRFLAMELVGGEDLARRLARQGPLSINDALAAARQICEALETAHEQGIIHRDLKPANVQLTPEGTIKVLDFGLAKTLSPASASGPSRLSRSPTRTSGGTAAGMVLGTAGYMSPEQARGEAVDQRADIWAFGCLLFEMLAGRPPFSGRSVTDLLAAVLRDDPLWEALPRGTPASVRRLLRHCLARDPRRRLRHMGDAGLVLTDVVAGDDAGGAPPQTAGATRPARPALPWLLGLVAIAAIITATMVMKGLAPSAPGPSTSVELRLAGLEGTTNRWGSPPIALSPDSRTIAYVVQGVGNGSMLGVRSLDNYERHLLPGTEGATGPVFSPDGRWIAFFTNDELRKVPVSGGGAQILHHFDPPASILGAAWTSGDQIVFGVEGVGLQVISAAGGAMENLTTPATESGERHHGFPFILPGGRDLLFMVAGGLGVSAARPALLSRDTGEWHTLLPEGQRGGQPHYSPSGHLVYASGDRILAAPLDLSTGELTRTPVVVVEDVQVDPGSGVAFFALALDGTLLYLPGVGNHLVWVDRQGRESPIIDVAGDYLHPRMSPDGGKIAILHRVGANTDIWVVDVKRRSLDRLTHDGDGSAPLWTVDGMSVTFAQVRPGATNILVQRADGSGEPIIALEDGEENRPMSWSPDGRVLAFERRSEGGTFDIWSSLTGQGDPAQPLIATTFSEESPRISPDGLWLAYVSNHSGEYEVYMASYPQLDRRWKVSSGGGTEPAWGAGSDELFFRQGRRMLVAPLSLKNGRLNVGQPELLFAGDYNRSQQGHAHYDVAPDGLRFVMVTENPDAFQFLRLVLAWDQELTELIPE